MKKFIVFLFTLFLSVCYAERFNGFSDIYWDMKAEQVHSSLTENNWIRLETESYLINESPIPIGTENPIGIEVKFNNDKLNIIQLVYILRNNNLDDFIDKFCKKYDFISNLNNGTIQGLNKYGQSIRMSGSKYDDSNFTLAITITNDLDIDYELWDMNKFKILSKKNEYKNVCIKAQISCVNDDDTIIITYDDDVIDCTYDNSLIDEILWLNNQYNNRYMSVKQPLAYFYGAVEKDRYGTMGLHIYAIRRTN